MFERFTDRSKLVLALANQQAIRHQHEYIGTEHILLGILEEGRGDGVRVLIEHMGDLEPIRVQTERLIKSGPIPVSQGKRPLTRHSKKVIQDAIEEARMLKHTYVGTEHLLLGLLRQTETMAVRRSTGFGSVIGSCKNHLFVITGALKKR